MPRLVFGREHYNQPTPKVISFWTDLGQEVLLTIAGISYFTKFEILSAIIPVTVIVLKRVSKFYGEVPGPGEYKEYTAKVPSELAKEMDKEIQLTEEIKKDGE